MLLLSHHSDEVILDPKALAKVFKSKPFPKGLASVGQVVVEKLGDGVGIDFGEVVNPYGDDWEIRWADGKTEMISQPKKNLALALQCAQQVMFKGCLMECTHYDSKGCHLVASSSAQPSSSAQLSSPTKTTTTRSTRGQKKSTDHEESASSPSKRTRSKTGTEQSPTKTTTTRSTRGKKKSTDHEESASSPSKRTRSKTGTEQSPTKTTTTRSTRGKKKSTDHEQSPSKKTKTKTLQWKRCRAKKISNDQRTILTDEFTALFAKNKDEVSFLFAERSLQEYAALQKSPLHTNARNLYRAAIGQVMCQVVPETDKPLDGNASKVFECLWPVCQKVSYYC